METEDALPPPRELTLKAGLHYQRIARRLSSQGNYTNIDTELLCLFCETLALYEQCRDSIAEHGLLVTGRSAQEKVRHPALTPLAQSRTDLIRLAKAIPLVTPKTASADIEGLLSAWL